MYYKKYGKTGVKVSAIGMGCMRFEEKDILDKKYDDCIELILYAHEKGINYFDTAPFYCHDQSESIVGKALSQVPRNSFYITSKTNLATLKHDPTESGFRRRLEMSLSRLKVDYIDFYYLWCMLDEKMLKENCDILIPFFEKVKKEGLIRHFVLSSHMEGDTLNEIIDSNIFDGILLGYNPLNYKYRKQGIAAAYKAGLGVSIMNPLGGGLIPRNPKYFSNFSEKSENVAQGVLRSLASHKEISLVLNGFSTKEHVDDAVKAVEELGERPMQEVQKQYEKLSSIKNKLCTGCGYCNYCPKGIDIPKYMDAYNEKILGSSIIARLRKHWRISARDAGKCIKCRKCEKLCTQHLPITERLEEIANIIK
ncbi:aldo/keto reductase [Blautia producta]|nr:aldo/keto reductase [Blautia producta]NSG15193.1 aldo/keto reductase [Blautia producta]NSJ75385.1 aldo/keto reductase [Blautia producta]